MNPSPPAVPNLLTTPVRGVRLTGGVLRQVFEDNVRYLLEAYPPQPRYALEYGPILLAAVGPLDDHGCVVIRHSPDAPAAWLQPVPGKPLHFAVSGQPDCEFLPYYEVRRQPFTCFPIIQSQAESMAT